MEKMKKYGVLEIIFPISEMTPQHWKLWAEKISSVIYEQKQYRQPYLLTLGQDKSYSIGFDVGEISKEDKFNSTKYLLTDLSKVVFEDIIEIVNTDEFYLGRVILLLSEPTEQEIKSLIILWEKDIVNSGIEFFKMGSDGCCFYWYNPENICDAENVCSRNFMIKKIK